MPLRVWACLLSLLMMGGCATIIEGTDQTISLESNPPGADCKFIREDKVIANLSTPGGAVVEKSKYDIIVECEKKGYQTARMTIDSEIEGATFGNIAAGGLIGWAVDSSTGADNEYAENVTITLVPEVDGPKTAEFTAPIVPGAWRSLTDEVQAYGKSGGTGKSVPMPRAVPLTLLKQSEDKEWGLFEYRGEGGRQSQAWIRLNQVVKRE